MKTDIRDLEDLGNIMNKVLKGIILAGAAVLAAACCICGVYSKTAVRKAVKTIAQVKESEAVLTETEEMRNYLLSDAKPAPTKIYFLDKPLEVDAYFYDGRLYVPFEETYNKIVGLTDESSEKFGIIYDNFIFSGYGEDEINPYFKEINGKCYISFYKIVKGMGLTCRFESENDKAFIYYRKTDESDMPETVENDNAEPALLRLEDITPDAYCKNPRYTDEGLEKLRVMGDYLMSRDQSFYVAWIMRYVNPEEGIDVDFTKETNTYTASFLYTLDYLLDRGGKIIIHGYTHQFNDYFSADGYEFGYFSALDKEERARRLVIAKTTAELLGYDGSMFEFPHYGATGADLAMAETVYDVLFQAKGRILKADDIVEKKAVGGKNVSYVPLPAYYLNNIYELDDMLDRIQRCEDKDCLVGLFFHPSIDFDYISVETTPWGVRNWHYTPYGALPTITDKILEDGYGFTYYEDVIN